MMSAPKFRFPTALFVGFILFLIGGNQSSHAKMRNWPIGTSIGFYEPFEAIFTAHLGNGADHEIIVDKVYSGPLQPGQHLAVSEAIYQSEFDPVHEGSYLKGRQTFVLFASPAGGDSDVEDFMYYRIHFENGWKGGHWIAKRIINGKVYDWPLNDPSTPIPNGLKPTLWKQAVASIQRATSLYSANDTKSC